MHSISRAKLFSSCSRWHWAEDPKKRFRFPHTWNDKFAFIHKMFKGKAKKSFWIIFQFESHCFRRIFNLFAQIDHSSGLRRKLLREIGEKRFTCHSYLELHKYWKREQRKINSLKYTFGYDRRFIWLYLQKRYSIFSAKVNEFYVFHPVVKENTWKGNRKKNVGENSAYWIWVQIISGPHLNWPEIQSVNKW